MFNCSLNAIKFYSKVILRTRGSRNIVTYGKEMFFTNFGMGNIEFSQKKKKENLISLLQLFRHLHDRIGILCRNIININRLPCVCVVRALSLTSHNCIKFSLFKRDSICITSILVIYMAGIDLTLLLRSIRLVPLFPLINGTKKQRCKYIMVDGENIIGLIIS